MRVGVAIVWISAAACVTIASRPSSRAVNNSIRFQANLKATPENPAYRLQIYSKTPAELPADRDWTLEYRYIVPPLPTSSTWNPRRGTVYQWGDVDFDSYGSGGKFKLSKYKFNQIVPQLFLGRVLDKNDRDFAPVWDALSGWKIEAQYYWYDDGGGKSFAQTGAMVSVSPGDTITTTIHYMRASGTIVASIGDDNIGGAAGVSTISIERPFPNVPTLFASWTDFFDQAVAASKTPYILSQPVLDVETYFLDQETMCGLLPLVVGKVTIPGVRYGASEFGTQQVNGFACHGPVVKFAF